MGKRISVAASLVAGVLLLGKLAVAETGVPVWRGPADAGIMIFGQGVETLIGSLPVYGHPAPGAISIEQPGVRAPDAVGLPSAAANASPGLPVAPQGTPAFKALKEIATTTPRVALQSAPQYVSPTGNTFSSPRRKAKGISISKAAAEHMALGLDLEGMYYSDGRVILSGTSKKSTKLDAALFLTAIRLACEPQDPYFSLDPVSQTTWTTDSGNAIAEIGTHLENAMGWDPRYAANRGSNAKIKDGISHKSFLIRRDYPALWNDIISKYPGFKNRLVFKPEWLRETRFGKILFDADVLLKEISSGAPILNNTSVQADRVKGYVPRELRKLRHSFSQSNADEAKSAAFLWVQKEGGRMWFDLVPSPPVENNDAAQLARAAISGPLGTAAVDGNATDITKIYPILFMRRRDDNTGKEFETFDPISDEFVHDVNAELPQYMIAYEELQALTDVFRAYVVAVRLTKQDARLCSSVRTMPLMDTEKQTSPLPELRQSDITFTMMRRVSTGKRMRNLQRMTIAATQGGVALRYRAYGLKDVNAATPITEVLKAEIAKDPQHAAWTGTSGKQFIALTFDGLSQGRDSPTPQATPYGEPLSREALEAVLPYALIARDVRDEESNAALKMYLEKSKYDIPDLASTGFRVSVEKSATGPIIAAFHAIDPKQMADLIGAISPKLVDQVAKARIFFEALAAADIAKSLKQQNPDRVIVLTGAGFGGTLAAFAGKLAGVANVVTFNSIDVPELRGKLAENRIELTVVAQN